MNGWGSSSSLGGTAPQVVDDTREIGGGGVGSDGVCLASTALTPAARLRDNVSLHVLLEIRGHLTHFLVPNNCSVTNNVQ